MIEVRMHVLKVYRLIDFVASVLGLVFLSPVLVILVVIGLFDTGSPLLFQKRMGRGCKTFTLVKFRTMRLDTPHVATHLATSSAVTRTGRFLRHYKLDELPQLWNVLLGDMSLVGPRPCLPNQTELIDARKAAGLFDVRPGITGLAQVRGIDMSDPLRLVAVEKEMLETLSLRRYFDYVIATGLGRGAGDPAVKG